MNGSTQTSFLVSLPQGSVFGSKLWSVYFNDLLQIILRANAYAYDCTLLHTYSRRQAHEVVKFINRQLKNIKA